MAVTYTDLVNTVPRWLYANNRDLVADMPTVIEQAQEQLVLSIDHDLFQTTLPPIPLAKGAAAIDLTGLDIFEVRAVQLGYRDSGGLTPLERRGLEFLTMTYASNRPGRPRFYAEDGDYDILRVFPTPNVDYTATITANVKPPFISDTLETNIITEKFPRVMEKAVMRQAAIYMKNQADEARYAEEMGTALTEANLQVVRRRRDETGSRPIETANAAGI